MSQTSHASLCLRPRSRLSHALPPQGPHVAKCRPPCPAGLALTCGAGPPAPGAREPTSRAGGPATSPVLRMGLDSEPGAHGNLALQILSPERPSLALHPHSRLQALVSRGPCWPELRHQGFAQSTGTEPWERALDRPRRTRPRPGTGPGIALPSTTVPNAARDNFQTCNSRPTVYRESSVRNKLLTQ